VVLVADDPANVERLASWTRDYYSGNVPLSILAQSSIRVGSHVTLYWSQVSGDSIRLMRETSYSRLQFLYGTEANPYQQLVEFDFKRLLRSDRSIAGLDSTHDPLIACAKEVAASRGWIRTWQVTELDCRNRNVENAHALQYFPQLVYADLRDNAIKYVHWPEMLMPHLQQVDVRNNPLWYDPVDSVDTNRVEVLFDPGTLAAQAPLVSLRDCGMQIENVDPVAQYRLSVVRDNPFPAFNYDLLKFGSVTGEAGPWVVGSETSCVDVKNQGAGIWVLEARKHGKTIGARQFLVTDAAGEVVQFILDDYGYHPIMSVPGISDQHFYSIGADDKSYQLTQFGLTDWSMRWSRTVSDLPVYGDRYGVYLVEARDGAGLTSRRFSRITPAGELEELPQRPVAGLPQRAVSVQGELWLFNIVDEWGNTPWVLVWNPHSKQWRRGPDIPTSFDSAGLLGGRFCVDAVGELPSRCWDPVSANWDTLISNQAPWDSINVESRLFSLEEYTMVSALRHVLKRYSYPAAIAEGFSLLQGEPYSDGGSVFMQPWPLLQEYDSVTDHWIPFGPRLSSVSLRADFSYSGGTLYALTNDSIARYPLAAYPPPQ
ncbi:MAG TPA: hypothetical protein VM553_07810, partial [Dongiaceae bacterium]|nr:hypothetical protein [Dongiaceae bacterium]